MAFSSTRCVFRKEASGACPAGMARLKFDFVVAMMRGRVPNYSRLYWYLCHFRDRDAACEGAVRCAAPFVVGPSLTVWAPCVGKVEMPVVPLVEGTNPC